MTEHAILQVQPTVADEAGSTGGPVSPLDHVVELPINVMEAGVVPVNELTDLLRHDTLARFPVECGPRGLGSEDARDAIPLDRWMAYSRTKAWALREAVSTDLL
jgi:hypothetical protein